MALRPTYYLADLQTGVLYGETLPLEKVSLSSSLEPGRFSAMLDMRKLGELGDGYRVRDLLLNGKCTLVPILEGLSTGVGNPPTSRVLGEWWISEVEDSPPSPFLTLSGPEFAGYAQEVLLATSRKSAALDPVGLAGDLLTELYTTGQSIVVDVQGWANAARVPVDFRAATVTYWDAISDLQGAEGAPFEWMIRTTLELDGWAPRRVIRTWVVGQPRLAVDVPSVTLELAAPGQGPASLTGFSRGRSEHRSASLIYGWGAGAGIDQLGPTSAARVRQVGEPVKSRMVSDRSALTIPVLARQTRAALTRATPAEQVFPAVMPTDRYIPRTGDVYSWRVDPQWTRPAESGSRRCVGWSWKSGQAHDVYELQLTEE